MGAMRRAIWLLGLLVVVFLSGCASLKPVLSSADEIARALCAAHFGQKSGMTVEQAARAYCETREAWEPWIGPALQAKRSGAQRAGACGAGESPAQLYLDE